MRNALPFLLLAFAPGLAAEPARTDSSTAVRIARLPAGGVQPVSIVDGKGTAHIVYLVGDPAQGDLFYIQSRDGGNTFSSPLRINSKPGSAVAMGNIRGARIAVGPGGRVHVAWNGSNSVTPKDVKNHQPMLYTRLNDAGSAFEPERNVIHQAYGLDGGGALAADQAGNVFVFWHAPLVGKTGEENRRVWVAVSNDAGKTFSSEHVAYDKPLGACGCCGMQAFADRNGQVNLLFRSAYQTMNRDMYLITSNDHGRTFTGREVSKWHIGACVMSTESFAQTPTGVAAAWETEQQVSVAFLDASGNVAKNIPAPGNTHNRKHPALASDPKGNVLLAWTEGMGWKKGGAVAWQVFDREGRPVGEAGRSEGVPVWGLLGAFPRAEGGFTILF